MPKRADSPQMKERIDSANRLLKILEETYFYHVTLIILSILWVALTIIEFRKDFEYVQSISEFAALVKAEGGAQPGPISEVFLSVTRFCFRFLNFNNTWDRLPLRGYVTH